MRKRFDHHQQLKKGRGWGRQTFFMKIENVRFVSAILLEMNFIIYLYAALMAPNRGMEVHKVLFFSDCDFVRAI